ncbi:rod shape-determining protein MreC [Edaphobacter albus]|uniref:rod shape-determining protein MreC n=1 Tax=Edaphobacter sp. 4G125 TaxID=2763071 RepID=UPI001646677A|nr:rod shape-determining protein MreC [Edaphobacter sp. 4G125]QNI36502.1 rod shape-determining protein MreC [Edaphobacter sp. 4G125]
MESFFIRFKNVLVLVAVLLVQTIGLAIQVRRPVVSGAPDGSKVTLLRTWVVIAVTPIERLFHGIGYNVRSGWSNYVDLRNTRQQNHELKDEIARLRLEQAELAEDALQGHRLQALLNFQRNYVTSTVAAQVIGTSGTDQSRVLYLDKGAVDGLKIDQAVMTPDGVVGKIRETFPHTAQVLLLNDFTSGAGVLLASTRIRAILRGSQSGHIVITNLTPDERIKPGEKVLTSGGDQVYPRGLSVGTIESIVSDPDHQPYTLITVKPSTNLFQLEEVLVITGTQGNLPALAQKDLAQGAATAKQMAEAKAAAEEAAAEAAAQSAAQIIAEKLPSLQENTATDPNASADAAKSTDAHPAGVVPRPLPALRPDRYSPGATPPASTLKPGAENSEPTYSAPVPSSARSPQTSRSQAESGASGSDEIPASIKQKEQPKSENQQPKPETNGPKN